MLDRKYLQQFFSQLDKWSSEVDSLVEKMPVDSLVDGYPWVDIVGYVLLVPRDIESEEEADA